MGYRKFLLTVLFTTLTTSGLAIADDATAPVGKLLSLSAWVSKFPGSKQSLNATGSVMAPSPCHTATATKGKSDDSLTITLKVTIEAPQSDVECMQLISPIPFSYQEKPYSGTHKRMKISSEKDSQTIEIATVH